MQNVENGTPKAVEQLGNASAPVRLGGVYTLVSLVDEWLREENIEYNERIAERPGYY